MLDLSTNKPATGQEKPGAIADAPAPGTVREAVGIFKNMKDMRAAITELDDHFPRHAISVLGGRAEVEAEFGRPVVPPEYALENPHAPHAAPVRTEEKVIGNALLVGGGGYLGAVAVALSAGALSIPAVITAVAIGAGTGAAVGGILARLLQGHFTREVEEQVEQGGLLLWVHAENADEEKLACDILRRHGADNVAVHTIAA
jgi:hypothetical protein